MASGASSESERLRLLGNKCFQQKLYNQAVGFYSQALQIDTANAVLYTNRATAHYLLEMYGAAVADCSEAIKHDASNFKAWYRRAEAYSAKGEFGKAQSDYKQLYKLQPGNQEALRKYHQCTAELRRLQFEAAIAAPETDEFDIDIDAIAVPSDYDGPRLTLPVTVEQVAAIQAAFAKQQLLHRKYVYTILQQVDRLFRAMPSLVRLSVPADGTIKVFGDVHGQYYDVLNLFSVAGTPSASNSMLFNGDFVDRGAFSCEIIILFLAYKLALPDAFHLNRGNHEALSMNKMYGFERETKHKYGERAFDMFLRVFKSMPLAHTINDQVLVVHGGLFANDGVTLADIEKVDRFREPPESGIMCDILWSDPMEQPGRMPSKRGVGVQFGPDVTARFLADNKLSLLVRSHEVREEGYSVEQGGKCITIFSAPNYCDTVGNKGAFITFRGDDLKPNFTQFTAVPHPKVTPFTGPVF